MHRTQVSLETWQYERLKAEAQRAGRSISDLIRELVAARFAPQRGADAAAWLDGLTCVAEDVPPFARDHDDAAYGRRTK